jgi:hypothetical protein
MAGIKLLLCFIIETGLQVEVCSEQFIIQYTVCIKIRFKFVCNKIKDREYAKSYFSVQ